jgi:hypothetical protein
MRSDGPVADVDLLEYEQLKAEQLGRIGVRDNLVYATLAACGGVAVLAFGGGSARAPALLLLPPVCLVLGWTYLVNDQKVSAIGGYLRQVLGPRLGAGRAVLGWETEHRADPGRRRRKRTQVGVDLVLFCGSGAGALGVFFRVAASVPWLLLVVSIIEAAVLVLLAVEIVRCSDTSRSP